MHRPKTIILALLATAMLAALVSVLLTTIHGTLGRFFMDLFQLRLSLNSVIWLIVGLIVGYFIGVVDTIRKQNKEHK